MKQPCEYNGHKVLPTIRLTLTKFLMDEAGLNQVEISELLDISQAAVSHYYNHKRGDETVLRRYPGISKSIRELGEDMVNGLDPKALQERICRICKDFRGQLMEDALKRV